MRNSTWRVAFSMSAIAVLTATACAAKVGGTAAPADAVGPATSNVATTSTSTTRTATTSATTTRTTATPSSTTTRTTTSRSSISIPSSVIPTSFSGLGGDLPDNWPEGVTLPADAKITFSFGFGTDSVLTFTTGETPEAAFAAMDPQFVRAGWNQVSNDVEGDYASAKYTKGDLQLEFDLIRLGDSTQGSVLIEKP